MSVKGLAPLYRNSHVSETAGSQHTFLAEPGEDAIAFIVIEGALEFLDPQGHSMGLEIRALLPVLRGEPPVGSSEKRAEEQGAAQSRSGRRRAGTGPVPTRGAG